MKRTLPSAATRGLSPAESSSTLFLLVLFYCRSCFGVFSHFSTGKHFTVSKSRNARLIKGSIFNMFRFENRVFTYVQKVIL